MKGIEGATRRDSVPIIAKIMTEIMELLFPLEKNNAGDKIITEEERKRIVENVQQVVKISVRRILGGDVDVGEFIMTRVFILDYFCLIRDCGSGLHPETTKANRHILR